MAKSSRAAGLSTQGFCKFGAVLPLGQWSALAERLTSAGMAFELPPQRRFVGEAGEQALMFFRDPSGNAIEIKGFATTDRLFEA